MKTIKQLNIYKGKIAFLLGCLLMLGMAFPAHAAETSGSCGEQLTWIISGEQLTISGSGDMSDYSETSPAPWYAYAGEIRSVSLPTGLTSVGDLAFYGCTNLTSVYIPAETLTIGEYSFAECKNLLQVNFGSKLETIGTGAFLMCENLASVSFPDSLNNISTKAFYQCYGLQNVTVPASVTHMGACVFAYNTSLVRATINASLEKLPGATFYGCEKLADISLAGGITSVGEYCFQNCSNLSGIYTQAKDDQTIYELDKNLTTDTGVKDAFVADYEMPNTSVSVTEKEDSYIENNIIQTEDTVITVQKETDFSTGEPQKTTVIQAALPNSGSWVTLAETAAKVLEEEKNTEISTDIQLVGNEVDGAYLSLLAGKEIILQITTDSGVIWKIDMSQMTEKNFSGVYNFDAEISKIDADMTEIASENIYDVKFLGYIDFNATVGLRVGNYFDTASLYRAGLGTEELIDTVVVDQKGYSWYAVAGVGKNNKHYIGLNVENHDQVENAVIPETMQPQYTAEEFSSLTDEEGVQYKVTGRVSKWGITGKQFAIYAAVGIGSVVLIVSIVMISLNKISGIKLKYANMAREDEEREKNHEEEVRLEVLKELLGKKDDSEKKD